MPPRKVTAEERFLDHVDMNGPVHPTLGPCWLWTGPWDEDGYGMFYDSTRELPSGKKQPYVRATRWSFNHFVRPITPEELACHHCDIPPCIRPLHLFADDTAANMADRDRKNRNARGSRVKKSHLTDEMVLDIRAQHAAGLSTYKLATMFGVSRPNIGYIVNRKTWTHV